MFEINVTFKNGLYRGVTSEDRFQLNRIDNSAIYNKDEHARICTKVEQYGFFITVTDKNVEAS